MTIWKKSKSAKVLATLCSVALAGSLGLTGCDNASSGSDTSSGSTASAESDFEPTFSIDDMDLEYTDRDLDPSYDESTATTIDLNSASKTVKITEEGVYILSGTSSNTQVLVDCDDEDAKVQLVLDGADITCADGSAI